ncbi:PBECR3 domain-containing polyvalent protein [Clostridium sp. DL1XJH146]
MIDNKKVGELSKKIIDEFNLTLLEGQPILCGKSNIDHMKNKHPESYRIYGDKISEIINSPDFIAKHPNKKSIEYIKVFKNKKDDYVLVAVRASGNNRLFVKTLFIMDTEKVEKYRKKNALVPYE